LKRLIKNEDKTTYIQGVLKIYEDYEQMVFNISEQSKNETIASIKEMSLGQRMKLQQLITKRQRKSVKDGKEKL
jgi:hypothetical protein